MFGIEWGNPVFQWNTGADTRCIDGLSPGNYSVTITEGACETILDSIRIESPDSLQVVFDHQMPSCVGLDDGTVTGNVFGGVEPYTYQWSNGSTSPNISGSRQGCMD